LLFQPMRGLHPMMMQIKEMLLFIGGSSIVRWGLKRLSRDWVIGWWQRDLTRVSFLLRRRHMHDYVISLLWLTSKGLHPTENDNLLVLGRRQYLLLLTESNSSRRIQHGVIIAVFLKMHSWSLSTYHADHASPSLYIFTSLVRLVEERRKPVSSAIWSSSYSSHSWQRFKSSCWGVLLLHVGLQVTIEVVLLMLRQDLSTCGLIKHIELR
jgi:hypothetical protein